MDQALFEIQRDIPSVVKRDGKVIRVGTPKDEKVIREADLLLDTHVERRSQALAARRATLVDEESQLTGQVKTLTRTVDIAEWLACAAGDIAQMSSEQTALRNLASELEAARVKLRELESFSEYWETAAKDAQAAEGYESELALLDQQAQGLRQSLAASELAASEAAGRLAAAERLLAESAASGWLTRKWRGLPSPDRQRGVVTALRAELGRLQVPVSEGRARLQQAEALRAFIVSTLESFLSKYRRSPSEVLKASH